MLASDTLQLFQPASYFIVVLRIPPIWSIVVLYVVSALEGVVVLNAAVVKLLSGVVSIMRGQLITDWSTTVRAISRIA